MHLVHHRSSWQRECSGSCTRLLSKQLEEDAFRRRERVLSLESTVMMSCGGRRDRVSSLLLKVRRRRHHSRQENFASRRVIGDHEAPFDGTLGVGIQ